MSAGRLLTVGLGTPFSAVKYLVTLGLGTSGSVVVSEEAQTVLMLKDVGRLMNP
jgi:hypothetical protein